MQPYFDPTRKTTSKKEMEDNLKKNQIEDDLKKKSKKIKDDLKQNIKLKTT
jgi:hypothetical protein